MTKVPVEIRPLSAGPYPLVPNEGPYVPHEYFECGDPDWCLHEPAPSDDEEFFKLIPLPNAEAPRVFGLDKPPRVRDDMPAILRELGFSEAHSAGFAVVFHETIDSPEGMHLVGFYNGSYIDRSESEVGTHYPLAVHVLAGMSRRRTNHAIWHELGHAQRKLIDGHSEIPPYYDEAKVARLRWQGRLAVSAGLAGSSVTAALAEAQLLPAYVGSVLGTGGSVLSLVGIAAMRVPRSLLWIRSKEERFCERYGRDHCYQQVLIDN